MLLPFVATSLATLLGALSLLHWYWLVRGVDGGAAVPSRVDGTPLFRPGRGATFLVGLSLLLACGIVLSRAHLLALGLPSIVGRLGIWGVAVAFAARAMGDFRYVGLFKRVTGTRFARWDTLLFTPICLAIAAAATLIALSPA